VSAVAEVALFTDDLGGGVAFYRLLLGAEAVLEWPGGAIFAVGGTKLLIHDRGAGMDGGPPNEDHFAVAVTDLDASCAALRVRGHALFVEPRDYPWGKSAYLRDPDGRLVELAQA
jgi:catechol 2,3-dioxygenase-like lactoylglutathione lyase family enzyme